MHTEKIVRRVGLCVCTVLVCVAGVCSAQEPDYGVLRRWMVEKQIEGRGVKDPRVLAGSVIQIVLGFLGIIAVLIVLYGGFKWMTAAGNEENVSQAKKILGAGVIGLVIVLMAFALANFVVEALYNATNAG